MNTQHSIQFNYPIFDVRTVNSYSKLHLINSANIPADELEERTHELPEKRIPLNLVGEAPQIELAKALLLSKGYTICASILVLKQGLVGSFPSSQLVSGTQSKNYWKPASVVEYFSNKVVQQGHSKKGLDLACGAGRDSIFLASNGWQMTSVDASEHALSRVSGSAARANLKVNCLQLDIESNLNALTESQRTFDLIVIVRYLHRPLLPLLPGLLNQSGYIVYQTFMQGCEEFGSPKNPRFLLQENELATVFSKCKVIYDEVEHLNDGRPVNSFIAQKIVG